MRPTSMNAPAITELIIQQAVHGDPAALELLLRRMQPDVKRYARRYCMASDIDDAVQEALMRLTQRLPQLRLAAALSGWLMTTVKRECMRLAHVVLRHDALDDKVLSQLAYRTDDGLRMDISRALESLPQHYRQVVLLRDMEALTLQEIADCTGETVACVKSRLHRARALVREHLSSPDATL